MSSQRSGFTWVEALVLIIVLGLLVAMLMPAINTAPRSRRSTCSNNLKQLVLAVHAYHDAHNEIVPLSAGGEGTASWAVLLMPYMEQRSAWNALVETGTLDLQGSRKAGGIFTGFTSSTFVCPSRRGPMLSTSPGLAATPTDYVACNSASNCWALGDSTYNGKLANGAIIFPAKPTPKDTAQQPQGTFSFGGVTDGLSYTAFFGEKHMPAGAKFGTLAAQDANCLFIGNSPAWFNSIVRRMGNYPDTNLNPACTAVKTRILDEKSPAVPVGATFGSWHPEVCQFGMGDGSVQQISNQLDPRNCAFLIQRNDGQALELEY